MATKQSSSKNKDCVDADPRLVMAVLAIGMIIGAIFSPATGSADVSAIACTAPAETVIANR